MADKEMVPRNWEEIANMRLRLLEQDYENVINANITGDPDKYEGLLKVLAERKSSSNSEGQDDKNFEEEDFDDFQDGGYQVLGDDEQEEGKSEVSDAEEDDRENKAYDPYVQKKDQEIKEDSN